MFVQKYNPITGFAGNSALGGEKVNMIVSGLFTSDNKSFFSYIRTIEKHFGIKGDELSSFVIVLKNDGNALIYLNFQFDSFDAYIKSEKNKGEAIFKKDIFGINGVSLKDINISENDGIIICFKKNWKYGLYFDFSPLIPNEKYKINIKKLEEKLGTLYTILIFDEELDYINNNEVYNDLVLDGWYPFFELGDDYKILYNFYNSGKKILEIQNNLVDKFNKERLDKIQERWYKNPILKEKEDIIRAGVESFLYFNKSGYINCLKNLGTEIEGLLGIYYIGETGNTNYKINEIVDYIKNKITNSEKSNLLTIGFNEKFTDFLIKNVFDFFDINTGKINISRHTIGHGVALSEEYTKIRALQYILVIDQLYYYFIEK